MPGATMATVDSITKIIYGAKIESQLQDEVTAIKRIERTSDGVSQTAGGKYVDLPLKVRRNAGIGYRNEGEQLQNAGQQGYTEVHVALRYGYGRTRLTGQVMQLVETNVQAFASAMQEEMDGLKDDLVKDTARIVYQNGTGTVADVATGATTNTLGVTTAQWAQEGEVVDVIDRTTGIVLAAARNVTAVDIDGSTVTVDGAALTVTTNHSLYRQGNFQREPQGFQSIVKDSGVLYTLDPAVQPSWKSTRLNNSGTPRALSETLMIQACDKVRQKAGKKTTAIFTSLGVRRSYFNLLTQQRRYTDTKEYAGGFQGLPFNYGTEIPVVEDVDAVPGQMFGLYEPAFKIYRIKEWSFADDDNTVWKWVRDFDAWEAFMRQYWELGCAQRNAQFVIQDIIES